MPMSFKLITKFPIPTTKTTEAITRLRLSAKLTLLSTNMRKPLEAIIQNNRMDTPPITGVGIDETKAVNLPINAKTIAMTAAPPIT